MEFGGGDGGSEVFGGGEKEDVASKKESGFGH